jgi:hypothetical protein
MRRYTLGSPVRAQQLARRPTPAGRAVRRGRRRRASGALVHYEQTVRPASMVPPTGALVHYEQTVRPYQVDVAFSPRRPRGGQGDSLVPPCTRGIVCFPHTS